MKYIAICGTVGSGKTTMLANFLTISARAHRSMRSRAGQSLHRDYYCGLEALDVPRAGELFVFIL